MIIQALQTIKILARTNNNDNKMAEKSFKNGSKISKFTTKWKQKMMEKIYLAGTNTQAQFHPQTMTTSKFHRKKGHLPLWDRGNGPAKKTLPPRCVSNYPQRKILFQHAFSTGRQSIVEDRDEDCIRWQAQNSPTPSLIWRTVLEVPEDRGSRIESGGNRQYHWVGRSYWRCLWRTARIKRKNGRPFFLIFFVLINQSVNGSSNEWLNLLINYRVNRWINHFNLYPRTTIHLPTTQLINRYFRH